MATGDFCHIEFPTTDPDRTKAFFSEIFGWTFNVFAGFETYMMFRTPGGLGGGINSGPRAELPCDKGPILHLEVENIEETLARIEQMGGKTVMARTKISDEFGHFAVFLDNVGNRFALWSR
jgi:hypothetical protein